MATPNANSMYGVNGKLACSLLLLSFVVVISTYCSDDGEGATTYVDGDWYVDHDTTLSDGTWVVNGSVYVNSSKLTLDHAELILNVSGYEIPQLYVSENAELEVYTSEISGGPNGFQIEIHGDTVLDNSTVREFYQYSGLAGIIHLGGDLRLEAQRIILQVQRNGQLRASYHHRTHHRIQGHGDVRGAEHTSPRQ